MPVARHFRMPILLAGIASLVGLALWAGLPAVERALAALRLGGFILVVLIHLPVIVLMGVAWWSIGRAFRYAALCPFIEARLARDSVAELLPFSQVGGFAAAVRVLSLAGVPARAGALFLLADLLMELFGKLFYAMAGLDLLVWFRPSGRPSYHLLVMLALLLGAFLLVLIVRSLLLCFVPRVLRQWVPDSKPEEWNSIFNVKRLSPSGLLHVICWVLGGVEAWVTLRLMATPVTIAAALVVDSLATSLRTFGFWVPAALGVQEAAYVFVCALFGLTPDVAIALSLVRRARDIFVGVAGLAVWQYLEVRHARRSASSLNLEAISEP